METSSPEHVLIQTVPPEDFGILEHVHDGFQPPRGSVAIVAKLGAEIIGRVFLMTPVHVEGPWVRMDKRGGLVGKQLMQAAADEAKRCGVRKLFAYAADDQLADYLQRLGYSQEPYTVWTKEL